MVCLNWKGTAHNELATRFTGRDSGAADGDVGRAYH